MNDTSKPAASGGARCVGQTNLLLDEDVLPTSTDLPSCNLLALQGPGLSLFMQAVAALPAEHDEGLRLATQKS